MTDAAPDFSSMSKSELVRALKARDRELEQRDRALQKRDRAIEKKEVRIALLEEQLRLLRTQKYGKRSEVSNDPQADLFNEAEVLADAAPEDDVTETITYTRKKPVKGRRPLPEDLPREVIEHDLTEAEKQCDCGCQKDRIGESVSERLEYIPAKLYVERHVRYKYACRACEAGVQTAPVPPSLLPKSNVGPGLLAFIIIAKYQDSLPLYRLEQIFHRHGVDLPRNTLASWVIRASDAMIPVLERFESAMQQSAVVLMDETPIQVNREPDREAHQKSQMWIRRGLSPPGRAGPTGHDITLFHYSADRKGQTAADLLAGCTGALMTDGYAGYYEAARVHGLQHAQCWAHARRKFVEAEKALPKGKKSPFITGVLGQIRKLYVIERRMQSADPEQRLATRQTESIKVLERLKQLLDGKANQVPPKSGLGKAIAYALKHWPGLTVFTANGTIPIDNNGAENGIRPFVVGRKNWLFADTPSGAKASARWYSIIETAKAAGLEPYHYLRYLFARLPAAKTDDEVDQLMPWCVSQSDLESGAVP